MEGAACGSASGLHGCRGWLPDVASVAGTITRCARPREVRDGAPLGRGFADVPERKPVRCAGDFTRRLAAGVRGRARRADPALPAADGSTASRAARWDGAGYEPVLLPERAVAGVL